ncbi:hypothetical protein [Clostridium sp. BSD9I1]|uniref:hypothetical protein n=1 Tax=Clostridium sp. BSD9I1 TaxID=2003589 RepID=UPI00164429C2|nr:hypothetical protein [Clostridium sp. BSD9I1]
MNHDEIVNILNNSDIKYLVGNHISAHNIRQTFLKKFKEGECPSRDAIRNYIKNELGLIWDSKAKLWVPSKKNVNSPETLAINNEIEIENNNNSILEDENLSINNNSTNSSLSEKSNKELQENSNPLESTSNITENKATNSAKKGRKKGRKKSAETFVKTHEIEINNDSSSESKEEDSSPSEKSTTSTSSEKSNTKLGQNRDLLKPKNEEKNTLNSTNNENSINTNQSLKSGKLHNVEKVPSVIEDFSSNSKPKYKDIDYSFYPEYMECYGKEKYSLSLNSFVITKVEEIILEKYNKKMSKSKIINIALMEFIRINITDNREDD